MLKKLGVLVVPAMAVAAIFIGTGGSASADRICPQGQTNTNYCTTQCVVPRVIGKKLSKAKQSLAAHDCSVGKIKHKKSRKRHSRHRRHRVYRVIKQSVKPGTVLPAGSPVNLTVKRK